MSRRERSPANAICKKQRVRIARNLIASSKGDLISGAIREKTKQVDSFYLDDIARSRLHVNVSELNVDIVLESSQPLGLIFLNLYNDKLITILIS